MSVRVTINGEAHELPAGATVASVVSEMAPAGEGRGVAVALDGAVLPRAQWQSTAVDEGASLELVVAVQGG